MPIDTPQALVAARAELALLTAQRNRIIAATPDRGRAEEIIRIDRGIISVLDRYNVSIDPCEASASVPLVMLPVRVEAKLKPGSRTLRVRICPDAVHIDSLVRSVTDTEVVAGQKYWTMLWADPKNSGAWGDLITTVGDRRAGWVAHVTAPVNAVERGSGAAPVFGTAPDEVARGTVARCLPNLFVVHTYTPGNKPIVTHGNSIPPDLPVSPLAFDDDPLVDAGKLKVAIGSEWTVEFNEAVRLGMGVEVPLPAGVNRIDRLVVVGVRRSVPEEENAADFASLLASHRYTDGLSLPPAGTPTNNDDEQRSPYRSDVQPTAPPLIIGEADADAEALAALLGVAPTTIEGLLDSDAPRSTLGAAQQAANTALWFATWHPVLTWIGMGNHPGFSPSQIESARLLHRDHVRGAGHTPAMRIGAQPYGVLPVSNLARWKPTPSDSTATVATVIARTLKRWVTVAPTVPHIAPGGDVSDKDLLDILGTAPMSNRVRVRIAADGRSAPIFASVAGLGLGLVENEATIRRAVFAQYSTAAAKHRFLHSPSDQSRSVRMPLVSEHDAEVIEQIIAGGSPKVDSVLQALLVVAWDQACGIGKKAVPERYLAPLFTLVGTDLPIMELAREAVKPASVAPEPGQASVAAQEFRATVRFGGQPAEPVRLSQFEPLAEAQTSLAQVALDLGDTPEGRWVAQDAIATVIEAYALRGEVSVAMTALGGAPIDERRIAIASAVDVASHRVDAWASALAHSRVMPSRGAMTIGAFGYVENIELLPPASAAGWVQAPSPSHAVAAGVLASAHASNIGAKPGKQPFAIDLTSRRGPEIRRILEGVHAGQPLGALLGYQIERRLTGPPARFQLSLRELAPMNVSELNNELGPAERSNQIDAADVVDGLALLKKYPPERWGDLRGALNTPPKNAYTPSWPEVSQQEWKAVTSAMRAASDSLDAVSDAMLSESVLQYCGGNAARAAAAMDAAGTGGSIDSDLGVFDVRQSGRQLSHALFTTIPVDATGWSSTRPRAIAEPRGEKWAARRMGDPLSIIVTDSPRHTLAEAGWAALDLVYTDGIADLDSGLRTAIPGLADHPLADQRGADWPDGAISILDAATLAGTLRGLLAGARALSPDDLARSGEVAARKRTIDVDELLDRCLRLVSGLRGQLELSADAITAIDPNTLTVAEADVSAIAGAVAGLAAYGAALTPDAHAPTNVAWAWTAWHSMRARHAQADGLLNSIWNGNTAPSVAAIVDSANTIAETVLGDGFRLLPLLAPSAGLDDFATAVTNPVFAQPSPPKVAAFLRDHATVHAGAARVAEAQLIGKALRRPIVLTVVQLTERAGVTAAPGTDRWLAGPLPDDVPWPSTASTHAVIELVGEAAALSGRIAGIVFDGWVETLPFQPDPGAFAAGADTDNPLRAARATTGLAVNANQASARAPQVLLSLVSPDGKRWNTQSVVDAVLAAVDLAKARLVTLEKAPGDAAILPAIYVASPWLQPAKFFDFAELAAQPWDQSVYPFLSEVK
ncbi:hypothetical protein [Rhodococcus sp. NCIMB 12038]|uniref:hypothetical protein n=1 Tax=Rhodococcus sp. NCIMB 12038 TaxID=933800 RepID=UPI000B3C9515|nr:hypothetical protein [Rhodococcus sp. NCIMB 12038]OUS97409.1 hypothetical protein CA951_03445 [Rhodococcus sp. NCIMB 12038]